MEFEILMIFLNLNWKPQYCWKRSLNPQVIFWKSTEHFVKITKCYFNHCQQAGFIHAAHPKHNYQAVKAKAGTRLCCTCMTAPIHCSEGSALCKSLHFRHLSLGFICQITIFSLIFDCFKDAVTFLWSWIFFIFKSLDQIQNLCPEVFVATALVLPSAVGVSCS